MDAVVRFEQVMQRFGETVALRDVNLTVEPGTVTVLVGANGAGKSTTIRLCTGVLRPQSGAVEVFGIPTHADARSIRRRCGVVPPKAAFYDRLTGRENLGYAARLFRLSKPPIEREAERFGIADDLDRMVEGYSTGMRARLALARSMLHDPELLLFDEPTAGLDPEAAQTVRETVLDLAGEGRTVILSTHLLREAEGSVDQIVFMENSTVWDQGTPEELAIRHGGVNRIRITVVDDARLLGWLTDHPEVSYESRGHTSVLELGSSFTVPQAVRSMVEAGVDLGAVIPQTASLESIYLDMRRSARNS